MTKKELKKLISECIVEIEKQQNQLQTYLETENIEKEIEILKKEIFENYISPEDLLSLVELGKSKKIKFYKIIKKPALLSRFFLSLSNKKVETISSTSLANTVL